MKKSTVILQALMCLLLFSAKDVVAQGISHTPKCHGVTRQERTFLAAVEAGKVEVVKALLDRGISANTTDTCHNSALRFAVRGNHHWFDVSGPDAARLSSANCPAAASGDHWSGGDWSGTPCDAGRIVFITVAGTAAGAAPG